MIAVLLQRLQQASGLHRAGIGAPLPHNPTEDLSSTHPHDRISISDCHGGQLQQPTQINGGLFRQGRKDAAAHQPSGIGLEGRTQQGPGPIHPVAGQSVGCLSPHIGVFIGSDQRTQDGPALFGALVAQSTAAQGTHQERLLLRAQHQQRHRLSVRAMAELCDRRHRLHRISTGNGLAHRLEIRTLRIGLAHGLLPGVRAR